MTRPAPPFRHLERMTDDIGLLEHASGIVPRYEHGYCVDDVARGLIVVCREPSPSDELVGLAHRYLSFLVQAQAPDGGFCNRFGYDRRWHDQPGTEDWWGRALWGLGTAALRGPVAGIRAESLARFGQGADDPGWPWPEPRLSYANGAMAEAVIVAGHKLGEDKMLRDGLRMLEWLLAGETSNGHLSVVPVGGWRAGEPRPAFDQQPIEVAALADACARAAAVTGDPGWLAAVDMSVAWFLGDNDTGVPLLDEETGGGCDGLTATGRNGNQGAESTIAMISVLQQGRRLIAAAR